MHPAAPTGVVGRRTGTSRSSPRPAWEPPPPTARGRSGTSSPPASPAPWSCWNTGPPETATTTTASIRSAWSAGARPGAGSGPPPPPTPTTTSAKPGYRRTGTTCSPSPSPPHRRHPTKRPCPQPVQTGRGQGLGMPTPDSFSKPGFCPVSLNRVVFSTNRVVRASVSANLVARLSVLGVLDGCTGWGGSRGAVHRVVGRGRGARASSASAAGLCDGPVRGCRTRAYVSLVAR